MKGYTHVGDNVGEKKMLVTRKPLGETKVQLARKKFNWREKNSVGEIK